MRTLAEAEAEITRLSALLSGDVNDRDLCQNCGHWREEHYNRNGGVFVGDRLFGCVEYFGVTAPAERRATKFEEIDAARAVPVPA